MTQFLPMGGEEKKKKTMSQHPSPSANTGMFREGAAGGRQGLAMPLASCGRLAFQRTKHTLTTSPQQSLPKPVIFSTPGGSYLCFIRDETGTESFLYNTLLVVVAMLKSQKCRVEWARCYHMGLPVLRHPGLHRGACTARHNDLPYHVLSFYSSQATYLKSQGGQELWEWFTGGSDFR